MNRFLLVAAVFALTACGPPATSPRSAGPTVNNAAAAYDTAGARLDAHDGMIAQQGSAYYLVGTAYGCGFQWNTPGTPWCGVRVYRSSDLASWTPAGIVGGTHAFDPNTKAWQDRCGANGRGCFRPHIARRPDKTWVMWLNIPTQAGYAVLTAPAPYGPYSEVAEPPHLAGGNGTTISYGDQEITPDPADPSVAWIAYTVSDTTRPRTHSGATVHDIVIEKLDPAWTTGTGQRVRLGLDLAEAPALWSHGGRWYLAWSDPACPYCSGTGTAYATAPSPLGPWTRHGRWSSDSCRGQPADVNELTTPAGRPVSVWQTDRWVQNATGASFDRNQTKANTYLAPLTYAKDGTVPAQTCVPQWTLGP